jgi:hypothetical protein
MSHPSVTTIFNDKSQENTSSPSPSTTEPTHQKGGEVLLIIYIYMNFYEYILFLLHFQGVKFMKLSEINEESAEKIWGFIYAIKTQVFEIKIS